MKMLKVALTFGITSLITVVVGLAIYNRISSKVPVLAKVVNRAG